MNLATTFVTHGGKRFVVSTINRASSIPDDCDYAETVVMSKDGESPGEILHTASCNYNSINGHLKIVECLYRTGEPTE